MILHENRLPADDSWEISCLICYFWKSDKICNSRLLQIIGGALRVNSDLLWWVPCHTLPSHRPHRRDVGLSSHSIYQLPYYHNAGAVGGGGGGGGISSVYKCLTVTYFDEFHVTLSPLIGHTGEMWVSLLTVFTNYLTIIMLVLPEIHTTYLSRGMRFPTIWHFVKCRLGRASAASF